MIIAPIPTLTQAQLGELVNLYHLARVPLSGTGQNTKSDRISWAATEFSKAHPEISRNAAWKLLERQVGPWGYNPPVKVYDRIREIVATKGRGHRCDAACRRAKHTYRHIFKTKNAVYGMPDGSLVIR